MEDFIRIFFMFLGWIAAVWSTCYWAIHCENREKYWSEICEMIHASWAENYDEMNALWRDYCDRQRLKEGEE